VTIEVFFRLFSSKFIKSLYFNLMNKKFVNIMIVF
jgi:hypothetical protein